MMFVSSFSATVLSSTHRAIPGTVKCSTMTPGEEIEGLIFAEFFESSQRKWNERCGFLQGLNQSGFCYFHFDLGKLG